ncbi:hypothetical protein ACVBEJ_12830 [Porticoccus sp. GXU_MW_L64]
MIASTNQWIDKTNARYASLRQPCTRFAHTFKNYFTPELLQSAHFVVVDEIPKPELRELKTNPEINNFLNKPEDSITYKNTYYILRSQENRESLHFHELVHVVQWQQLGEQEFLQRYIDELQTFGYQNAPLENMAYSLQAYFEKGIAVDVEGFVRDSLQENAGNGSWFRR